MRLLLSSTLQLRPRLEGRPACIEESGGIQNTGCVGLNSAWTDVRTTVRGATPCIGLAGIDRRGEGDFVLWTLSTFQSNIPFVHL